ncbi:MAG: cadherin repeat domain-containing protein [Cyanobacteria bacterium J06631_9]
MVQKAAILPLTVGLTAGLAACQQAPEQAITSTSAAPTVLNTAEVYNPNELTIIAPANTLEGNSTLIQVAENSTEVIRVRAQDVPNARLSYRLQDGADMDKFIIDEKTGDLSFKEMPDWESPTDENQDNNYMVLWQVVSSSGSARSQFMIVKVTDLED